VAHAGQELEGPGLRLRLVKTGAETGGELLEMEAAYSGEGQMPPVHLHPRQVERFEVLEGTMHAIVGDTEARYEAGQVFEVPAATPHQMAADGPARVRWEVRPALRTAEFFEGLYALLGAEPLDGAALGRLFEEFKEEIDFG
jgi:mannose-6-phosphate isomerase-like protein (cupin superfamily)